MSFKDLPDFPWDVLKPIQHMARQHIDGAVDLSIGTPIDPTPQIIRESLREHADAASYPTVLGLPALREAMVSWCERRRGAEGLDENSVLATIGSKELITWLPTFLGLGASDSVAVPPIAYPSYRAGALVAGTEVVTLGAGSTVEAIPDPERVRLIWLNTPGNPHGEVLDEAHLRHIVQWARARGIVVASDECYAELDWRQGRDGTATTSILDPRVCGGSYENVLMVYSLSKQSNLAGYRAGLVAGDPVLVRSLVQARKHLGMMVPTPVQHAMIAALRDSHHVDRQRDVYRARRDRLVNALTRSGFRIDHSEAGLYLWCTRGEGSWDSARWFAERGIIVAPGAFYGAAGERHVRVGLTASDEHIEVACGRL